MKRRLIALAIIEISILLFFVPHALGSTDTEVHIITPQPIAAQEEAAPIQMLAQPVKEYRYIQGCPLSAELQQGIFDICERYNVSFEFVMAVIAQESSYNVNATGDGGDSKGLMQIQEKWHSELMEELGVSDLYKPLDNVEVGAALLQSYFMECEDVYYVLMKYNGGAKYAKGMLKAGKVSEYAREIVERAVTYELENDI